MRVDARKRQRQIGEGCGKGPGACEPSLCTRTASTRARDSRPPPPHHRGRRASRKNYFQLLNHSNLVIKLSIAILELVDPDLNQQLVREEELHKEPTSPPGWHIHQHLKGWHF